MLLLLLMVVVLAVAAARVVQLKTGSKVMVLEVGRLRHRILSIRMPSLRR